MDCEMKGDFPVKAAFYLGNQNIRIGPCSSVAPKPDEVQIKVSYVGICGTDLHIYHGQMDKRVTVPHIMGHEMSGIVHSVGENVTGLSVGDKVTVMPLGSCMNCPACWAGHAHICHRLKFFGIDTPGAFQSFWTVSAKNVFRLPDHMSMQLGAMIEPLAVACHDVRLSGISAGDYVVVIGGGPIGTLIALVAQDLGARVLVLEINPFRLGLLRELGIEAIHPHERDVAEYVNRNTNGAGADAVFEVSSSQAGAEMMTRLPRTRGRIVIVGIFSEPAKVDLHKFFWRELQMIGARVYEPEDFRKAIDLAASGRIPLDRLITDVYPLEQLNLALEHVGNGGSAMKVLVECS